MPFFRSMQMSPAWPLLGGPFYGMLCAENQSWRESYFFPSFSRHITATGRPPYTPMRTTPPPRAEKTLFSPHSALESIPKAFSKTFFLQKKNTSVLILRRLLRATFHLYFSRPRRSHYRSSLCTAPERTLVAKLPPGDDEPSLSGLLLLLLLDPYPEREREREERPALP